MATSAATAFLLLALVSFASATNFRECKFNNKRIGTPPLNATLGDCKQYPCDLVRGTKISGGIDFMYSKELKQLKPELTAFVNGLRVKMALDQKDGCASLTLNKCPVKENTRARFEYSLDLSPTTALVKPLVRFELKNEQDKTIICSEIPARIVRNPRERFQMLNQIVETAVNES